MSFEDDGATVYLERISKDLNECKFYEIVISRNLFGNWQIDRFSGRIGKAAKKTTTGHQSRIHAILFAYSILGEKELRGYSICAGMLPVIGLPVILPCKATVYLDYKVASFLSPLKNSSDLLATLRKRGIIHVADLISLSIADLCRLMATEDRAGSCSHESRVNKALEIEEHLAQFGMSLNCAHHHQDRTTQIRKSHVAPHSKKPPCDDAERKQNQLSLRYVQNIHYLKSP